MSASCYRVVDEYGKKGIEVITDNGRRFVSHLEIAISPRFKLPEDNNRKAPDYEIDEHYRASQLYNFYNRMKVISYNECRLIEEVERDLPTETLLSWGVEFRFLYMQQFPNKVKLRESKKVS